jgi:hypothetical protein
MADGIYLGGWNRNVAPEQWVAVDDAGVAINAGAAGELTEDAQTMVTTVTSLWRQVLHAVQVQASTFEITVPEFTINGNLHVTGLVHCEWQGSLIGVKYGGTGSDLSLTGGPGKVVTQTYPGAPLTVVDIGTIAGWSPEVPVVLNATFATNQAFRLVAGRAHPVTSLDVLQPDVDGITLESGVAGNTVTAAMISNNPYITPLSLPTGSPLFLGQDGKPTAVEPSSAAGDVWSVATMRQIDLHNFIFAPTTPIKLA